MRGAEQPQSRFLGRFRLSGTFGAHVGDVFEHRVLLVVNRPVPESQEEDAVGREVRVPLAIMLLALQGGVRVAVDLDDDLALAQ